MAKMLFTAIVADMRGKLAGTVFTKNRYGAVTRTKVSPVNRRSPAQSQARANLSGLSAAWKVRTQAERDSWQGFADQMNRTDQFGQRKNYSAQAAFISANSNRRLVGSTVILSAPVYTSPDFADLATSINLQYNTHMIVDLTGTSIGQNARFTVYATAPLSPGVSNANGLYKLLPGVIFDAADTSQDFIANYNVVFGIARAGTKVFVKLVPISTVGVRGAEIILSDIVAP